MSEAVIEDEAAPPTKRKPGRPRKNRTDIDPALLVAAGAPPPTPKEKKPSITKPVTLARFVPCLSIRPEAGGDSIKVPINADANKAAGQLLVSKVRSVLEAKLKDMKDNPATVKAKDIKDMADAAEKLDQLSQSAYAENGATPNVDMEPTGAFGRMAGAMLKEAAAGLAEGAANSLNDRFARMAAIGTTKKEDPKTVIEIES